MTTQQYQILIPETLKMLPCKEKRIFSDVIKLRILTSRDYLGLPEWALKSIISVFIRDRQREM